MIVSDEKEYVMANAYTEQVATLKEILVGRHIVDIDVVEGKGIKMRLDNGDLIQFIPYRFMDDPTIGIFKNGGKAVAEVYQ
jgi:hypothetical protein